MYYFFVFVKQLFHFSKEYFLEFLHLPLMKALKYFVLQGRRNTIHITIREVWHYLGRVSPTKSYDRKFNNG